MNTKLSLLALASVAVVASGCGAGNTFYVDSRFTSEEAESIRQAADMWDEATHGVVHMDLVFGARVDVLETKRNAIVRVGTRAAHSRFPELSESNNHFAFYHEHGAFDSDIIVVYTDQLVGQEYKLKLAMAHEMGHAFGAHHVEQESAVMYKETNESGEKCITRADLGAVGVVGKACDE